MDNADTLKSMLNHLINDNTAEASMDFHKYVTAKMKQISGIPTAEPVSAVDDEVTED